MDWVKLVLVTVIATASALAVEAFVTRGLSSSRGDAAASALDTSSELEDEKRRGAADARDD